MIKMVGFPAPASKLYFGWEKGIARCGDQFTSVLDLKDPAVKRADCFYQTNELKPKFLHGGREEWHGKYMLHNKNCGKPFIVSESEPFREHRGWLRFGWNSYRWNDADWNNDNVGPERWNRFEAATNIKFTDWHSPGDHILIMGQKEGDSSLTKIYQQGYESIYNWIADQIIEIRKHSDRKIVVRPHPRNLDRGMKLTMQILEKLNIKNVTMSESCTRGGSQGGEGLDADLAQAHCVVTYNSLSGVEAAVKGIPVFALDGGSMVHPIAHHNLSQIEKINYDIDLQNWKNKIAYSMWNKQDVQSGDCWQHLKGVHFK
jgi:hypothetical protein